MEVFERRRFYFLRIYAFQDQLNQLLLHHLKPVFQSRANMFKLRMQEDDMRFIQSVNEDP